jgi:hypothetical protein
MTIPPGRGRLEVDLEPPLVRSMAAWISGLAMVVFLIALGATLLPWFETPTSS